MRHMIFELIMWNNPELEPETIHKSLDYMNHWRQVNPVKKTTDQEMVETHAAIETAMRQLGGG